MQLGVCYYPEQWPAERWPVDARLMRQAGLSIVRLGEFAWAQMEPAEGQFDWEWLDGAVETLAAEGLSVVLCTPTAAPPAWLCRASPSILPVDAEGRTRRFGSRRHYCVNSAAYHRHTERIVTALGEHYGSHPAVVGWQIDNEFGCHDTARCYCPACVSAFRRWLRARYGSLAALNEAWGTAFWSQHYGRWDEIDPPNLTVAGPNPSHALDYWRFSSDSNVAYQQRQIEWLRPHIGDRFITTNLMGGFTDLDYHALARPLDLVSWDSYPIGYAEMTSGQLYAPDDPRPGLAHDVGDPAVTAFCHDLIRGLKQAPFWVMEQQAGQINWGRYNTGVGPGALRLWIWHGLISGADAMVFFRWRASLLGLEQYHSGLLNHDGSPGSPYAELLRLLGERDLMNRVAAHPARPSIALLLDYNDLWAIELQPHRRDFSLLRHLFVFYRALRGLGLESDIVSPGADLSRYRLVIAPTAHLGHEALAATLSELAAGGSTVLMGVRSGFKTPSNRVTHRPLPGVWRDLVGVTVTEWHSLPPGVGYDLTSGIPGLAGPAGTWSEALDGPAEALARYAAGPFAGRAALVENQVGAGQALYLGWYPTIEQAAAILDHLTVRHAIDRPARDLPAGVVMARRGPFTVALNFTNHPFTATIHGRMVTIQPREVQVISAEPAQSVTSE
jgi:beta-galactosidase